METVEEYFEWRNSQGEKSLEKKYIEETRRLKWKFTDTLYSFLGIFVVGLRVYCDVNNFADLKEILAKEIQVKSTQKESLKFIMTFVKYFSGEVRGEENKKIKIAVDELKNLKEMKQFLNVYTSIGNVFPIWPGGNEHRGKSGCYDIPDIYFNNEDIVNYSEHFFNTYCTNNFMQRIRYGKYYTLTRDSLLNFDREEYRNFLIHINDTIHERDEKINNTLELYE